MRGAEADVDAQYVMEMAARCGIRGAIGYGQGMGWNEQQARDHRYAWLTNAARENGANVIVTAHTSTDQAMTVLLRMLRGTHTDGLAGIPPRRELSKGMDVARPLLHETRDAGIAYLNDIGVASRHDPTNDNTDFPRNRLRNTFADLKSGFNGNLTDALCRIAGAARDDSDFIAIHVLDLLNKASTTVKGIWDRAMLADAHPALQSRAILDILARELAPEVHEAALVEMNIKALAKVVVIGGKVVLPGGFHVESCGPWLVFSENGNHSGVMLYEGAPVVLPNGQTVRIRTIDDDDRTDPTGMQCMIALADPAQGIILRLVRNGDRLGPNRKVADVCRAAGIPPAERSGIWVAVCPETGDVLWVPGVAFGQLPLRVGATVTHLLSVDVASVG